MPLMIASHFFVVSAGMIESNVVFLNLALTPISFATPVPMSMSEPIGLFPAANDSSGGYGDVGAEDDLAGRLDGRRGRDRRAGGRCDGRPKDANGQQDAQDSEIPQVGAHFRFLSGSRQAPPADAQIFGHRKPLRQRRNA